MFSPERLFVLLFLTLLPGFIASATEKSSSQCERLQASLTYPQDKAPKDIMAVLPLIVEKVNHALEGVVDVEVLFTGGDEHRKVGEHVVQCSVTRLASAVTSTQKNSQNYEEKLTDENGTELVKQCFHVPFTILDTNECTLPPSHSMHHKCHEPAICVNTLGSYECLCPMENKEITVPKNFANDQFWEIVASQKSSPWHLSFSSFSHSSCPSSSSTHKCCASNAHTSEGSECRSRFRCPLDPCSSSGSSDCHSKASCIRADSPLKKPNYICQCPPGLMGNGHYCRRGIDVKPRPMVNYDGVTPTEETIQNGYYCGCTKPIIDPCAGFPSCPGKHEVCIVTKENTPVCGCKPGFVFMEEFGCSDETPPILQLRNDNRGDGITRLKQGDTYKESAVDIIDENAEDYLRSLKIAYSQPLPRGCLSKTGSFHVNYTVATPWTSPPYVRVTRSVVIEDIDECTLDPEKFEISCPDLVPRCDTEAGAVCRNLLGSYTCECPKFTTGDGFQKIFGLDSDEGGNFIGGPHGYKGGTGCTDTSKPIIKILGPNPKVFRTGKCEGLIGVMKQNRKGNKQSESLNLQRNSYEASIKKMIQDTAGAELCATHTKRNPRPQDCVQAFDETFRGRVDLTSRVQVGEPIKKSEFEWKIAYNVMDDAGNVADTVWRGVTVEEVDFIEMEKLIREEVLADREFEIQDAVRIALERERKKTGIRQSAVSNKSERESCPECPACDCNTGSRLTPKECESFCKKKQIGTCDYMDMSCQHINDKNTVKVHPIIRDALDFLEHLVSPEMASLIFFIGVLFIFLLFIRILGSSLSPRDASYYFTKEDEEREQEMMNSVQYYRSPEPFTRPQGVPATAPPKASMSSNIDNNQSLGGGSIGGSIFSPQENRAYNDQRDHTPGSQGGQGDSIYRTMNPITPSSSGDSRGRRISYNLRRRD